MVAAPAYVERRAEEVDGKSDLRLTYWLLYGMNEPLGSGGDPIERLTHEGDWGSASTFCCRRDDDEYAPVAVRLLDVDGGRRDVVVARARAKQPWYGFGGSWGRWDA